MRRGCLAMQRGRFAVQERRFPVRSSRDSTPGIPLALETSRCAPSRAAPDPAKRRPAPRTSRLYRLMKGFRCAPPLIWRGQEVCGAEEAPARC